MCCRVKMTEKSVCLNGRYATYSLLLSIRYFMAKEGIHMIRVVEQPMSAFSMSMTEITGVLTRNRGIADLRRGPVGLHGRSADLPRPSSISKIYPRKRSK